MEPGLLEIRIPFFNTGLSSDHSHKSKNETDHHRKRTPYEQFTSHNRPVEYTKIGFFLNCLGAYHNHKSLTLVKIFQG